jgi:hypothetical protein
MYLNFRTGLNKYSGLLEMCEGYEVLEKAGHRHTFNGEVLGFFKDWKTDINVWNKILPALEEKLKTKLCFNNDSLIEEEVVVEKPELVYNSIELEEEEN